MSVLIKNCNIKGKVQDALIENGVIKNIAVGIACNAAEIIDGKGLTALPAFIDIHSHLREPGAEYKEDIESGSRAAVRGGYSAVCAMPNTKPVTDNKYIVKYILDRAKEVNLCKVYPIAAITTGSEGKRLCEMATLSQAGAVAFSDDGLPVANAQMMRIALEYAKGLNLVVASHSEDTSLSAGGVVNEGANAGALGLKGINRMAEETAVARDIIIAENLSAAVHICHVSTKGSVQLIREAKARGVKVTAETAPHYIALTDDAILGLNPASKVNPPLREESDRLAIIEGIKDGTIDAIACDHAPHHEREKTCDYESACFGISGLESAFSVCYTVLVKGGYIDIERLSELLTAAPARIMRLPHGELKAGGRADITLVDTDEEYVIDKSEFVSRGKNTPFDGHRVTGRVVCTVVGGNIKYRR